VAPDISVTSGSESHGFIPDNLQVVLSIPPLNLHPMQTRSKSGILKKKAFSTSIQDLGGADVSLVEPSSYKSAVKIPVWLQAMKEEVNALHAQNTWSLVSLPANRNLVGCKWIFKVKRHPMALLLDIKQGWLLKVSVKNLDWTMGRRLVLL
jgi:histone deacetylase 1/2